MTTEIAAMDGASQTGADAPQTLLADVPGSIDKRGYAPKSKANAALDGKLAQLKADYASVVEALNPAVYELKRRKRVRKRRQTEGNQRREHQSPIDTSRKPLTLPRYYLNREGTLLIFDPSMQSPADINLKAKGKADEQAGTLQSSADGTQASVLAISTPATSVSPAEKQSKPNPGILDPQLFEQIQASSLSPLGANHSTTEQLASAEHNAVSAYDTSQEADPAHMTRSSKRKADTTEDEPPRAKKPFQQASETPKQQKSEVPPGMRRPLDHSAYVRSIKQTKKSEQGPEFVANGADLERSRRERLQRIREDKKRKEVNKTVSKVNGSSPSKDGGSSPAKKKQAPRKRTRA